jgi:nucleoside-diphosphate-sugar epimerase
MSDAHTPTIEPSDLDQICQQTVGVWEELRGKRIFVTGGTGFFGCWLLESFAEANRRHHLNAQITVLTRSPETFRLKCPSLGNDPGILLLQGDVRAFVFPDGEFEYVIHAAAQMGAARYSAERTSALGTLSTIFDGTRNMLDFAVSHGTRKFLMVSSGAVYGTQPPELSHLSEDYGGAPNTCIRGNSYGEAKRAAEALCAAYATPEFECKIARCFSFIGAHLELDGNYAIGNFIRDVLNAKNIRISGDGTPLRSYLYATDLAAWLWTILVHAPSLFPVNVGSDQPISIAALATEVKTALKSDVAIEIAQEPVADALPQRYLPAVLRASELGLKQTVELREAIKRTASWYLRYHSERMAS